MEFFMLWMTMGLGVLMMCGIQETIAYLGVDYAGGEEISEGATQVYVAFCMTLLVMIWPLVLMEMVRGGQR
ncbi:MAG: hypothetical protein HY319_02585 [Armatimonadetes bacterium]|nr:hypothetical protein [Armatimonadota bacterium]